MSQFPQFMREKKRPFNIGTVRFPSFFLDWVNVSKRGAVEGVLMGLYFCSQGAREAALPAQGKLRPSQFFFSNLHFMFDRLY